MYLIVICVLTASLGFFVIIFFEIICLYAIDWLEMNLKKRYSNSQQPTNLVHFKILLCACARKYKTKMALLCFMSDENCRRKTRNYYNPSQRSFLFIYMNRAKVQLNNTAKDAIIHTYTLAVIPYTCIIWNISLIWWFARVSECFMIW